MTVHVHPRNGFEPPVVRLDGVEIPAAEIAAEMQHHEAPDAHAAWHAAAEALVLRRLLLAEAGRQGLDDTPQGDETREEALVRRLLESELRVPEADEATCRRWYEANRARFRAPDAWHASHILFAADPDDAEARDAAAKRAEAVLAALRAAPDAFAELARDHSACPSGAQGGDLGLVEAGTTVPEFEAALRGMTPGETRAGPVATRFGLHILRLHRHEPGRQQPFEAVQPRIAAWLHESAWRRAAHQFMALLAARATVEGIALSAGADGPLVQ